MRLRKTSFLAKLLIVVLIVYAIITLVRLQDKINATNTELSQLQNELNYKGQEIVKMEENLGILSRLKDRVQSKADGIEIQDAELDEAIKRIARERLGMVSEGEIVFYDSDD